MFRSLYDFRLLYAPWSSRPRLLPGSHFAPRARFTRHGKIAVDLCSRYQLGVATGNRESWIRSRIFFGKSEVFFPEAESRFDVQIGTPLRCTDLTTLTQTQLGRPSVFKFGQA